MKQLNVGMVGYGFMGKAHSNAYRQVNHFFDLDYQPVLKAVCGRTEENVRAFAAEAGWESIETEWRKLIERDDIDVIDIAVPNNLHRDIALAAAAAGKMIWCEKPLARNGEEGREMVKAVQEAGVRNMVWYNYRRVPAVMLAKIIIDSGRLGKIYHYRTNFLQDWTISTDLPQGGQTLWRLDVEAAGSGVTGDLLAHNIDTAIWLNGDIARVSARTKTFITERYHTLSERVEPVGIDDATMFMCDFANGSLGLFEATRYARGHKALYTLEINGEHASIRWDLHDMHRLEYFDHGDEGALRGWRSIHVTDNGGDHPYMDHWWVPGLQIGYGATFIHQVADFLKDLETGEVTQPDFENALVTQDVCDAVLSSGKSGHWVEV